MLRELELDLMPLDLWVWPVATAPICADGPRQAFQMRRRMVEAAPRRLGPRRRAGCRSGSPSATAGTPATTRCPGPPTPTLWAKLGEHADHVRYRKLLGGVPNADRASHPEASRRRRPERRLAVPRHARDPAEPPAT